MVKIGRYKGELFEIFGETTSIYYLNTSDRKKATKFQMVGVAYCEWELEVPKNDVEVIGTSDDPEFKNKIL